MFRGNESVAVARNEKVRQQAVRQWRSNAGKAMLGGARSSNSSSRARTCVTTAAPARIPFLFFRGARKIGRVAKSFQRSHDLEVAPVLAMQTSASRCLRCPEWARIARLNTNRFQPPTRHD